jgi:hypothetical protein
MQLRRLILQSLKCTCTESKSKLQDRLSNKQLDVNVMCGLNPLVVDLNVKTHDIWEGNIMTTRVRYKTRTPVPKGFEIYEKE